jgi:hypothetical protein
MKHFIPEESNPSEHTLNLIRLFAYSYRTITVGGKDEVFCLN